MADTFEVQPKRGDPYKSTVFPDVLGRLFSDGVIYGYLNSLEIDNTIGGLNVKVKTGRAIVGGCAVDLTVLSDSKALTDTATNYVFLELTKNGSNRITGAQFTINTTGTPPSNPNVLLAKITTSGGSVTNVYPLAPQPQPKENTDASLFGNGQDGDLEILSGTTTLTETKYYNNVWVKAGAILTANDPMILFVKNTLRIDGTLHMNAKVPGGAAGQSPVGGGGSGSPAAGPPSPGGPAGSATTGTGGTGAAGANGPNPPAGGASGGGTGGTGANGGGNPGASGGTGGTGAGQGPAGATPASTALSRIYYNVYQWLATSPSTKGPGAAGSGGGGAGSGGGGGGGADDGAGPPAGQPGGPGGAGALGGVGGSGGGSAFIFARNLILGSAGIISSNAGSAGNGANGVTNPGSNASGNGGGGGGNSGSGGGGGGGGWGGLVMLVYAKKHIFAGGTVTVTGTNGGTAGTAAGAHGSGGTPGGAAGSGPLAAGSAGANGGAGVIIEHQV